ncbi:MAG: type II toxin-antitoxin system RelE/ParE family toxin [Archaeoglobaceae archaeon]
MKYKVFLSKRAEKFLKNLEEAAEERIKEKLRLLADNPFCLPYKKVKGRNKTYRIRVGDFRVLYTVTSDEVRVLKVDWRKRVYKR